MQNTYNVPYGYCYCGCGRLTSISTKNRIANGYVKGQPMRFCKGHQKYPPIEERFWKYVNKTNFCWLWTGTKISSGYGRMWLKGKVAAAHRISWELHNGTIPDNLCVLHTCDTPACVNPAHLFLGTQKDNAIDREEKGRSRDTRGEKQGAAKLTEAKVRQIFVDSKNGMTQREIGKKHGVSQVLIGNILRKESWAWLWK